MRSVSDYKDWFYRHMPRGPVWPQDATSTPVWDSLLDALAQEPARVDAFVFGIVDAFIPGSDMTANLLDSWEQILGLTAQAADADATRVARILAQLTQDLSPSLAGLQTFAAGLKASAVVTHQEFPLFFLDTGLMGDTLYGTQWAYTWTVTYDAPQDPDFETSVRAVSPAHTTLLFTVNP